jgi:diguanylate cyclase (GGDEF)-like protein
VFDGGCPAEETVMVLEAGFVGWISLPAQSELAGMLETPLITESMVAWSALPQPALLAFGVSMGLLTIRYASTGNRIDKGSVWALAATFVALQFLQHGWNATNHLATASLFLILATYAQTHRERYYDRLTAIPSRVALDQALYDPGKRYTVGILSIDRLKEINLQYGYAARDAAVRTLATKLSAGTLIQAFRYTEDSFALLFRDRGIKDVHLELERIREQVQTSPIALPKRLQPLAKPDPGSAPTQPGQVLSLTVSIGAAERGEKLTRADDVLSAAEKQLLRAKRAGGNQVKTEGPRDDGIGAVHGKI